MATDRYSLRAVIFKEKCVPKVSGRFTTALLTRTKITENFFHKKGRDTVTVCNINYNRKGTAIPESIWEFIGI